MNHTGREQTSPFKTLAAAYEAALDESAPVRIVVLSDIDVSATKEVAEPAADEPDGTGAEDGNEETTGQTVLSNTGTEELTPEEEGPFAIQDAKVITIAGGGNGPVTLTRSGADGDSVLEIGGGAQVTFTNIKINGKKGEGEGIDRRALKITGDAAGPKTKVTLGNGVIVTGRITASSGMEAPDDKDGSGILVSGNAELAMTGNSNVSGCVTESANYAKGAVVVTEGGVFTMDGASAVSGNTVTGTSVAFGGGVYVYGGTFTMGGTSAVSDNTVTGTGTGTGTGTASGGGVYVYKGTSSMGGRAEISRNRADSTSIANGGGVYVYGGTFSMSSSAKVSHNTAANAGHGGGVFVTTGNTFTMSDSAAITDNTAIGDAGTGIGGGGVYISNSNMNSVTFTMSGGSAVSGNTVEVGTTDDSVNNGGGGIYIIGFCTFMMDGGKIENNTVRATATGNGGGMFIAAIKPVTLNNGAVVSGNNVDAAAASGGGMYITAGNITMNSGSTVSGNTATGSSSASGGGVNFSSTGVGKFTMTGGTVSGNKAVSDGTSSGGGFVQTAGTFVMSGGTIYGSPTNENDPLGNTAVSGAAYYKTGGNSDLAESIETTITDGVAAEAVVSGE